MKRSLTFSVGIPTFNQGEFLEETILSLLNQTRPPDEIVISDHYSTDNTPEIIEKYAKHVRGVKPPPGVKLAGQYTFTLESQTCDWITIFCSDDIAFPNYGEVLMRGAAQNPDAALIRAGWQTIDQASGEVTGRQHLLSAPRVQQPPATIFTQLNGPKVCGTSFAIRREAFLRSGPILASVQSLVDWALFVQVAPFGAFVREPEIIAAYRHGHDGNKFRKRIAMWLSDEQQMFEEIFPLAFDRAGISSRSRIKAADRQNFIRYLSGASEEFAPVERAELVPLFRPWAERVGGLDKLRAFANGGLIANPTPLLQRAKSAAKPFLQGLYSRLHST